MGNQTTRGLVNDLIHPKSDGQALKRVLAEV